jgi:hypothetical protein
MNLVMKTLRKTAAPLLLLLFSVNAHSDNIPSHAELASSKQWLRLLHFRKHFPLGNLKSEVIPGIFFFSPNGNTDPLSELEATLEAFKNPKPIGKMGMSPQCSFPARYHFLKEQLHLDIADEVCPELDAYLKKINGDAMSLVFSAAYPHSPPSMFGHTMIRIHSKDRSKLLDYGINYAAMADKDDNSIAFAVLGLMGGYYGQFAVVPYYMKVNEYNHAESRDLWEYDLHFSKKEIRTFLWHLWEIDHNALFRYYFFDENCSYRILTMIEAAKPDWDLSQFAVEVIPAETVKRLLETPGAVDGIHHRPSLHVQMVQRFDALSPQERRDAFALTRGEMDPKSETSPAPLDSAITYYQYRRLKGANHLKDDDQKIYGALLIQRASLSVASAPLPETNQETRPDLGHAPYQLGVGGGYLSQNQLQSGFTELHFKFAYHDLLNNDVGYIPFTQVDFPNITLRYMTEPNSLWLERLGVFTVTSLSPMDELEKQLSWKVDLSYISPKDLTCTNCHVMMFNGGAGAAKEFFSGTTLVYGLVTLDMQAGSSLVNGFRFMPTLLTGVLSNPWTSFKTQITGSLVSDVWQSARQNHFYEAEWNNSLSLAQNWELRSNVKAVLPGDRQNNVVYREFGMVLNRYF